LALTICDVGPRDGLQNESEALEPAVRAELVNRLAGAGLPRVEAVGFVRDDLVPQMAGAEDVVAGIPGGPGFPQPEARAVSATCDGIRVYSVYVPNGRSPGSEHYAYKLSWLAALRDMVAADAERTVVCGDINIARSDLDVHPRERKPGIIGQRPEERELFEALLAAGLTDVGRTLDPENAGLFTWWPPWRDMRRRNIGWRLDYVLASKAIAERAQNCKVLADFGTSDHAPVVMTL